VHTLAHSSSVIRSMQAFSMATQMQKVALELLAFASPSAELAALRKVFVQIDTDASGTISRDEFANAMQSHPEIKEADLSHIFDQMDFSHRGEISYNEFLAASLAHQEIDESTVRLVFSMLDQDQDEIVSRDDISRSLGNSCTDEEIDAMFTQLGCTSGRLFFNDFNRLMTDEGRSRAGLRRKTINVSMLSEQGRANSLSNLVVQSEEVDFDRKAKELGAPKSKWLQKGRTLTNLTRFIKDASALAEENRMSSTSGAGTDEGSSERSPRPQHEGGAAVPPRPLLPSIRRASDGGVMVVTGSSKNLLGDMSPMGTPQDHI